MRKAFINKKGMTLMEILLGSLLFGMVVMTVSAVLAPMMMTARRANDLAEYNQVLDTIGNKITSEMSQGEVSNPNIINTVTNTVTITTDAGVVVYSIAGGPPGTLRRTLNGTETFTFHDDFYRGKTVNFEVALIAGSTTDFNVSITVQSTGSAAVITRTYAVRPMMQ